MKLDLDLIEFFLVCFYRRFAALVHLRSNAIEKPFNCLLFIS